MQRPVDGFVQHLTEVVGGPVDESLLLRALTHRSYAYENGGLPNNERLEFLGDSVLGLVVTDTLYATHPDLPEGQLAKLRAAVVNMRALADVARTLGLGDHVMLGRGEESTGGRDKASILADTMEAVIGTVYLSCGMAAAARPRAPPARPADGRQRHPRRRPRLEDQPPGAVRVHVQGVPEYRVEEEGPDHEKTFHAQRRRRRRGPRGRHRPVQEGSRAARRRARLAGPDARARPATPATAHRRGRRGRGRGGARPS